MSLNPTPVQTENPRPTDLQVHVASPARHRFLFLDALRGVAALFIVTWHLPGQLLPSILSPTTGGNQWLAVDFFFCLSGFVVAFSYEKRLAEGFSMRDFIAARLIRLYPVYLIGMVLGVLVEIVIQHTVRRPGSSIPSLLGLFAISLFMLPTPLAGISGLATFPLDTPAWSLFLEIIANLVYARMVKWRIANNAILALLSVVAFAILLALVLRGGSLDVGYADANFGLGFARIAYSFSAGILLFRLYRDRAHSLATSTQSGTWIAILLILLLVILLLGSWEFMRSELVRLFIVALCFPAIVFFGAYIRIPHSLTRLCTVLGELSYPFYLLHKPIISLLFARRFITIAVAHPTLKAIGLPLLVAILARAAWWVGERVDLPIRRRLALRYNILTRGPAARSS